MSFEVESEESFTVGLDEESGETKKNPQYTVRAEGQDFSFVAEKKGIDETEFVFSWPTDKQVYDYAQDLHEKIDRNIEVGVFYLSSNNELLHSEVFLDELVDGWNNISATDEEDIAVYELTNALAETQNYGLGWSRGVKGSKELHVHFCSEPDYDTVVNWLNEDLSDISEGETFELIRAVEEEFEQHQFSEDYSPELEADDLLDR